jgi:hypothetical protein
LQSTRRSIRRRRKRKRKESTKMHHLFVFLASEMRSPERLVFGKKQNKMGEKEKK